jgi:hypothetical protein
MIGKQGRVTGATDPAASAKSGSGSAEGDQPRASALLNTAASSIT